MGVGLERGLGLEVGRGRELGLGLELRLELGLELRLKLGLELRLELRLGLELELRLRPADSPLNVSFSVCACACVHVTRKTLLPAYSSLFLIQLCVRLSVCESLFLLSLWLFV